MVKSVLKLTGVACVCVLISCNNQTPSQDTKEAASDSASMKETEVNVAGNKFTKEINLPFVCDTAVLMHLDKNDSLSSKEVKWLSNKWVNHDLVRGVPFDLQAFYTIDSVKAIGKYQAYCDSLQIGQTQAANAYALGKIVIDNDVSLLLWGLTMSSYEACPFSTSRALYFTVFKNGAPDESFFLGEYVTFADPPVGMERTVKSKLGNDLVLAINSYQENDQDMDAPDLVIEKAEYGFKVENGTIKLVSEKKFPDETIKKKKP